MDDIERLLMRDEGTGPTRNGRFLAYADCCGQEWKCCLCEHKGSLTIGYGHNLDANGLPFDLGTVLLKIGIADAIAHVRESVSCYDSLSRPRQLVLISMAFNLGKAGLAKFVRFIDAVHRGDHRQAAREIRQSKAAMFDAPARYDRFARMWSGDDATLV